MTLTKEAPERRGNGLGHDTEGEASMLDHRTCACGCGQPVTSKRSYVRFVLGHQQRALRKPVVKTLTEPRRLKLYEAAGFCCQRCGLSMAEQLERFGRRLEVHHKNHDHSDNSDGNHDVLCTACHNQESLAVRDEVKKGRTFTERRRAGLIRNKADGQTHCKRGHEFTSENTKIWQGSRHCRTCTRARDEGYRRARGIPALKPRPIPPSKESEG